MRVVVVVPSSERTVRVPCAESRSTTWSVRAPRDASTAATRSPFTIAGVGVRETAIWVRLVTLHAFTIVPFRSASAKCASWGPTCVATRWRPPLSGWNDVVPRRCCASASGRPPGVVSGVHEDADLARARTGDNRLGPLELPEPVRAERHRDPLDGGGTCRSRQESERCHCKDECLPSLHLELLSSNWLEDRPRR